MSMRPILLCVLLAGTAIAAPVPKTDPPPPITPEHINASRNNLIRIGLAFHIFESANGFLPDDITDKNGKPLLSWRVAILTDIDQNDLYKQFKLDEPWDSENNKKLIEKMPKMYAPIRVKAAAGLTFYQTFTGKDALFGGKVKNPKFLSITDGTSSTGLVFEAGEPVIWSKPADIPFDEKKPLPKLGGLFDGDFNVAMVDGSVKSLKKDADETHLKYLIMPADGNEIDFKKLEK
jgi:prepilin-type processing-associated H-X9-DG protein